VLSVFASAAAMNRFSGRLRPCAARVTAFAIVTWRSDRDVWLFGFAVSVFFIGTSSRLLARFYILFQLMEWHK
jgi:hypothetical protein